MGRTTAAQWIRVAFHDFVTADVANGTGGIDASIGFETLREENSGSAFNDSFSFFRPYVNPVISSESFLLLPLPLAVVVRRIGDILPWIPVRKQLLVDTCCGKLPSVRTRKQLS
jgi:hypothetical protein